MVFYSSFQTRTSHGMHSSNECQLQFLFNPSELSNSSAHTYFPHPKICLTQILHFSCLKQADKTVILNATKTRKCVRLQNFIQIYKIYKSFTLIALSNHILSEKLAEQKNAIMCKISNCIN